MLISKSRKAQIWSFDLLFALTIFVAGLLVIYFYAFNYSANTSNSLSSLYYDADLAANIMLGSDDYSFLTDDGKLNQTLLDEFDGLSDSEIRRRYSTTSNFYIYIPGMTISGVSKETIGIVNSSQTQNQILISRIVIYNNRPTRMEVLAWD